MKIKLLALLICLPVVSFAKEPQTCNSSMQSHPDMIDCIQTSTKKQRTPLKRLLPNLARSIQLIWRFIIVNGSLFLNDAAYITQWKVNGQN